MIRYSIGSINFSALTLRFFCIGHCSNVRYFKRKSFFSTTLHKKYFQCHFDRNVYSPGELLQIYNILSLYWEKYATRDIKKSSHTQRARKKLVFIVSKCIFHVFFLRSARSRYLVRIVHSPFGHPLTLRLVLLVLFWDASIRIRPRYDKKLNRMRDRENQLSTTNCCPCKSKCHTLTYASVMPETTNKT